MKKFAAFPVLLSLILSLCLVGAAQTRPRRAQDAAPAGGNTQQTPQQTAPPSDYYDPNKPEQPVGAPPVLKGGDGRPVTGAPADPNAAGSGTQTEPGGPEEVDENDVIKVDTALVTLPVSVTDRDGKYVGNLRQKDFKIYEDGVEQDLAYFAPVEKPFTVALLLDMSNSTKNYLREIQDAAITFVDQLRRDDRVMVISFDDDVHVLSEPTSDRNRLRSAIRSSYPGNGTSLYDAVDFVLNQRFNRIDGRKAMVLFTDGVDTTSRLADYPRNVQDAEEDGALAYVLQYDTFRDMNAGGGGGGSSGGGIGNILIDILGGGSGNVYGKHRRSQGGGTSEEEYRRADSYLHAMANRTGARVERANAVKDLDRAFATIAEELRRQYSLGYYPKNAAAQGSRHSVRVRVMRPNLAVKARNSYITGEQMGPKNNGNRLAGPTFRPPGS